MRSATRAIFLWLAAADAALVGRASAFGSRRSVLAAGSAAALGLAWGAPLRAEAEADVEVYFGCGCFWHVQHEFVEAERKILGRSDGQLTALAGYAGGLSGAQNGNVCYHNAARVADYGSLGHAEVVRVRVPPSKFGDFAKEYAALFDSFGNRPDQSGDRGPEYRNLVGIPGGTSSPLATALVEASKASGDKLDFAAGRGNDADMRSLSWIMDSDRFPFFQAEQYHQFHDGFAWGEDYPNSYNGLGPKLVKAGAIKPSGCPNGMLGVGIAGL